MSFVDKPTLSKPPALVLPYAAHLTPTALAWGAVDRAVFDRFQLAEPTTLRYLNWKADVASGNVQVGVVRLSGVGHADFTKVMDSGVIACPAAADLRTDLGATLLLPGDYALFVWADNTTVQTRWTAAAALAPLRTVGVLTASGGVPATGTFAWSNNYVCASLEGDF